MTTTRLAALTAAFLVAAGAACAQDEGAGATQGGAGERVAEKTDWTVFVSEDAEKTCWSVSAPKESKITRDGRIVAGRRGDILLFVTFRPGENVAGEVSFNGGYPFAPGSTVTLQVGDSSFELFTDGETAWPTTEADDAKVVATMKRGTEAVVTGRSSRGNTTTDTFSLFGFTAAFEDAEARCSGG